jgi:hypothetical protein
MLYVFKGDTVRTYDGDVGEVLEIWGIARPFAKLLLENGSRRIIFRTEVSEIIRRCPTKRGRK